LLLDLYYLIAEDVTLQVKALRDQYVLLWP